MSTSKTSPALATIEQLMEELSEIAAEFETGEDTRIGFEKIKRWKARAIRRISDAVTPGEAENLQHISGPIIMGDPGASFVGEVQNYAGFLQALHEEIKSHPEDVFDSKEPAATINRNAPRLSQPAGNSVFLIHGHDELNLYKLRDILRDRHGLGSIILAYEPGKGRTLIEKFEEEAQRAAYAFALLTPDDLTKKSDAEYSQARPNVIFELGWFYGRLGRDKVCILFKKGTKIHSDLDGVSRIEFTNAVTEKIDEIEKELQSAQILKRK